MEVVPKCDSQHKTLPLITVSLSVTVMYQTFYMSSLSPYSSPPEQGTAIFNTHVWKLVQQRSFPLPVYPFLHNHIHLSFTLHYGQTKTKPFQACLQCHFSALFFSPFSRIYHDSSCHVLIVNTWRVCSNFRYFCSTQTFSLKR